MKVQKNTLNIIPFLQWKGEWVFPAFASSSQPGLKSLVLKVRRKSELDQPAHAQRKGLTDYY